MLASSLALTADGCGRPADGRSRRTSLTCTDRSKCLVNGFLQNASAALGAGNPGSVVDYGPPYVNETETIALLVTNFLPKSGNPLALHVPKLATLPVRHGVLVHSFGEDLE